MYKRQILGTAAFAFSQNFTGLLISRILIGVGVSALAASTTASSNVAVGGFAGKAITTGGDNVAIGYNSLTANTTGNDNMGVGYNTLKSNIGKAAVMYKMLSVVLVIFISTT